jgi:predicted ArsR family transcriptional regulator
MSAAIIEYLATRPEGAKAAEIADEIGICVATVCQTLGRLLDQSKVEALGKYRFRTAPLWRLVRREAPAGSITFKGAETLAAMQAVCRARLMGQMAEAA